MNQEKALLELLPHLMWTFVNEQKEKCLYLYYFSGMAVQQGNQI
jgi:hypothetical protein